MTSVKKGAEEKDEEVNEIKQDRVENVNACQVMRQLKEWKGRNKVKSGKCMKIKQ